MNLEDYLDHVRIPDSSTSIYVDECAYTFHTQEYANGLFVDLHSYVAFSFEYVQLNYQRTNHAVYLNIYKERVAKMREAIEAIVKPEMVDNEEGAKLLKSWLNEGDYEYEVLYSLVVLPDYERFEVSEDALPPKFYRAVEGLQLMLAAGGGAPEASSGLVEVEPLESKYAYGLYQEEVEKKVPRTGWACAICGLTQNLWLNLSDGIILCGRKSYDGTGGNGHALDHYNETGYPLVVKLGTISPYGRIDVYSYAPDENDTVIDPLIERHLLHWGIDIQEMKKTEQTTSEMEKRLQYSHEWSQISEEDKGLEPVYGPGYTGMINLGNTCYMASIMQVFFSIPAIQLWFYHQAGYIFDVSRTDVPPTDFYVQLAKLANGLMSGEYSTKPDDEEKSELEALAAKSAFKVQLAQVLSEEKGTRSDWPSCPPGCLSAFPKYRERGIRPTMFRNLIKNIHADYASSHQQDAMEFFPRLLEYLAKTEKQYFSEDAFGESIPSMSSLFDFLLEERTLYRDTSRVRYTTTRSQVLTLSIPFDRLENKEQYERYLEQRMAAENDEDVALVVPVVSLTDCLDYLTEEKPLDDSGMSVQSLRLASMPAYLVLEIHRFYTENWVSKKLDVNVVLPDELDMEKYRGRGLQTGEMAVSPPPESKSARTSPPSDKIEKTGEWGESVLLLMEMGFSYERVIRALDCCQGDTQRAIEWLVSGQSMDEANTAPPPSSSEETPELPVEDGPGKYELFATVSHIGQSMVCGHYVCHIKKEGKWILYNDEKVMQSHQPPLGLAYGCFYRRKS
ncbi:ubiquitin carboxyl-terminal hydrolase 5-like isoform X3 [Schistocerca gregaria]|uniref:ubiquitin carboxyl-terminal hydrolase 5-like isoform X3 n=1 Tax=Schistocerca gregaria TaxID=7010 RepID=UPI00211E233A|nr:ubiquitin carboxyl-terminal hydrolase 5-like isoform X3 [Schistocerca gregaria]